VERDQGSVGVFLVSEGKKGIIIGVIILWEIEMKVVEFVGIQRINVGGRGDIIIVGARMAGKRMVVEIIFRFIDGLSGIVFNDEVPKLEKWLALMEGKGMDTGNGQVCNREFGPSMAS
jgi:hypothetical protein